MLVLYRAKAEAWGGVHERLQEHLRVSSPGSELRCQPAGDVSEHAAAVVLIPAGSKVDQDTLAKLPNLRLIQQTGAGVDAIDLQAAQSRGIPVANVPTHVSGAAEAVAEHALGMMIALGRRHSEYSTALTLGRLGAPAGSCLFGKTVGIVGFGAIGRKLSSLLAPFHVSIVAISRRGAQAPPGSRIHWIRPAAELPRLLQMADVVVLACPLNPSTRSMLNHATLRSCKPGACIINVARGPLLDHQAALEALEHGHIGSLGLDVFEREPADPASPLLNHPRTMASPHVAAATIEVADAIARLIAENVACVSRGQAPLYEVSSPPC